MSRSGGRATFVAAILAAALLWQSASPLGRPVLGQSGGVGGSTAPSPVRTVLEIGIPQQTAYPLGITTDGAGNVWFAEDNVDAIVEYSPSNSSMRTFPIPTNHHLAWIWYMVFDSSGNLWFADDSQPLLWRFDPTTSSFSNFTARGAYPMVISYDPGLGRIWFSSLRTEQVGYFAISGGDAVLGGLVNVTAPAPGAGVSGIALTPSGNVYVAESFQAKILELDGGTLGEVGGLNLPRGSEPVGLAFDASRNRLWYTDHGSSFFGYVNLNSSQATEYPTSLLFLDGSYAVTLPYWIEMSSTGELWFNEHIGNRIARFDPATAQLTEFDIPTNNSSPLRLTVDDGHGAVWFSEFAGNAIGRIWENSSEESSVTISARTAVLSPSATLSVGSLPASQQLPGVSTTSTDTGVPEPGFQVSVSPQAGSFQLQLSEGTARPGNYSAAVCFAFPQVNECGYLTLEVPTPPSTTVLVAAIYLVVVVSGAAVIFALWREYRSPRRRLRAVLLPERLARVHPSTPSTAAAAPATGSKTIG